MQDLADFRRRMLAARISPATAEVYSRFVEELRAEGFACSYDGLLRYFCAHERDKSVGQMRTMKCAVLHFMRLEGRQQCPGAEKDLDMILQGLATLERERRTEPLRGAIEDEQLTQLVKYASQEGHAEYGDAFTVMRGIACRPRDIGELTPARVNLRASLVQLRSKRARHLKAHQGAFETHPICTTEALAVLSTRMKRARNEDERLFPGWRTQRASAIVKRAASAFGWPRDLKWDGAHCLRHGSANAVLLEALERVRIAGGWRSMNLAKHYSNPNGGRRTEAPASPRNKGN